MIETAKKQVEIMIPGGTFVPGVHPDDDQVVMDEHMAEADTEVFVRFCVSDAQGAAEYIQAAEVLGFHCTYDSGDPISDDTNAVVVVKMRGRTI